MKVIMLTYLNAWNKNECLALLLAYLVSRSRSARISSPQVSKQEQVVQVQYSLHSTVVKFIPTLPSANLPTTNIQGVPRQGVNYISKSSYYCIRIQSDQDERAKQNNYTRG